MGAVVTGEQRRPCPPEIVGCDVPPAIVAGRLRELLAAGGDPPPERSRRDLDERCVARLLSDVVDGPDRRRQRRRDGRLPVLVALRDGLANADYRR